MPFVSQKRLEELESISDKVQDLDLYAKGLKSSLDMLIKGEDGLLPFYKEVVEPTAGGWRQIALDRALRVHEYLIDGSKTAKENAESIVEAAKHLELYLTGRLEPSAQVSLDTTRNIPVETQQ